MANVVTINRPEVVSLIEQGAKLMTNGNKTEAVAMAMRELIKKTSAPAPCSACTLARSR